MEFPTLIGIATSIEKYPEVVVIGIMFIITLGIFFLTVKIAFWFREKESRKYEKITREQSSY